MTLPPHHPDPPILDDLAEVDDVWGDIVRRLRRLGPARASQVLAHFTTGARP